MRSILELCISMDTLAEDTYARMAETCENPDLATVFERMGKEESHHITWWKDLIDAWDQGLVPDVVNDTEGLERHMHQLVTEMETTVPESFAGVSDDTRLDIAARMEFFMLDPIFGELLDLTEPGGARNHREAYARHLERVVGAIELFYSQSDLARFLARILRRAWRDNLALATFASRDPLTGLYNRRGLITHLEQWRCWADRYNRPLGTLLVDVDDFKTINDTHGHAVGDVALKKVADALASTVRGSDMVARYGGDEFAIVAPETDVTELTALGRRLLDAVSATSLTDWDGNPIRLSISIGGAVIVPGTNDVSCDQLLAQADASLYAAKRAGKRRVGDIDAAAAGASVG